MDMQLNAEWIRSERERRAMSQEQLAAAAGLGSRTIQRVEKTGAASFETTKAIASVFETTVEQLTTLPPAATSSNSPLRRSWLSWRKSALAASLAIGLITALVWTQTVHAGQLLIDVGWSLNDQRIADDQVITKDGKEAEIRIDKLVKVVITPTVQTNGQVFLELQLYEFDGSDFVLSSSPKLLVVDNSTAEIRLTSDRGSRFEMAITPHVLRN
jgi:transcriptional regulator with XRE-family HTH domain